MVLASPVLWQGATRVCQSPHGRLRRKAGSSRAAQPHSRVPLPGGQHLSQRLQTAAPRHRPSPCLVSIGKTTVMGKALHYSPLTPKRNVTVPPRCTCPRSVGCNLELAVSWPPPVAVQGPEAVVRCYTYRTLCRSHLPALAALHGLLSALLSHPCSITLLTTMPGRYFQTQY